MNKEKYLAGCAALSGGKSTLQVNKRIYSATMG